VDDLPAFPYAEACLQEAMRLFPPAHTTNRECTAPGGCSITMADGRQHHLPQGTWVHFNIWGLHHNEEHWPEPQVYR